MPAKKQETGPTQLGGTRLEPPAREGQPPRAIGYTREGALSATLAGTADPTVLPGYVAGLGADEGAFAPADRGTPTGTAGIPAVPPAVRSTPPGPATK